MQSNYLYNPDFFFVFQACNVSNSAALLFPPCPIETCLYLVSSWSLPASVNAFCPPVADVMSLCCVRSFRKCWVPINGHLHCLSLTWVHPLVFDLKFADVLMSWKAFLQWAGVSWQTGWPSDLGGRKYWCPELFCKHLCVSQHRQVATRRCSLGSRTYVAAPRGRKTSRRKTHVASERRWLLWTCVFPRARLPDSRGVRWCLLS